MHRRFIFLTAAWLLVAGSLAAQTAPATGDQHREYLFAPTGQEMPYRIYVPTTWDGKRSLPILLFLHGAGANESTYLDMAGGLLGQLAEKHGYIVVSPLGFAPLGAYGNPLRLPAVFGESGAAAADVSRGAFDGQRWRVASRRALSGALACRCTDVRALHR